MILATANSVQISAKHLDKFTGKYTPDGQIHRPGPPGRRRQAAPGPPEEESPPPGGCHIYYAHRDEVHG
jgi:hypothetical protein